MATQDSEAELLAFLSRVVPGFPEDCAGATEEQIERIDRLSGGRLPPFYRWFLRTMGGDLGPLKIMLDGCAARDVIEAHESQIETPPGLFLIAAPEYDEEYEDSMPRALYYDLDESIRGDAFVLMGPLEDTMADPLSETLRDKIAYSAAYVFCVTASPHYCKGTIRGDEDTISDQLDAAFAAVGFSTPIAPQRYTKVMETQNETLVCTTVPNASEQGSYFFRLGGSEPGQLRRVLGQIADARPIELKIDDWERAE